MPKIESYAGARLITPVDYGLIFNSLLKSYQQEGFGAEGVEKALFFANHKRVVEKTLARCRGIAAVNIGDPDQIYAYILFDVQQGYPCPIIHYVYVKRSFRNLGFAKWLIDHVKDVSKYSGDEFIITHNTKSFKRYMEPKGKYLFNPYMLGELYNAS